MPPIHLRTSTCVPSQRRRVESKVAQSRLRISGSSGKRPFSCFENRSSPSRRTSNWPRPPGVIVALSSVFDSISAARLAARVS